MIELSSKDKSCQYKQQEVYLICKIDPLSVVNLIPAVCQFFSVLDGFVLFKFMQLSAKFSINSFGQAEDQYAVGVLIYAYSESSESTESFQCWDLISWH